jgi:hypothetical protein
MIEGIPLHKAFLAPYLRSDDVRHKNLERPAASLNLVTSVIEPQDFDQISGIDAGWQRIPICTVFYPDNRARLDAYCPAGPHRCGASWLIGSNKSGMRWPRPLAGQPLYREALAKRQI